VGPVRDAERDPLDRSLDRTVPVRFRVRLAASDDPRRTVTATNQVAAETGLLKTAGPVAEAGLRGLRSGPMTIGQRASPRATGTTPS
jgi:hypothetical protein